MLSSETAPSRTIIIDGKAYLFFSGFSYLGLAKDDDFKKLIAEGFEKYGVLFPSSRISNTRFSLNELFEKDVASFSGTERAAGFSSGYLAAQGAAAFAATKGTMLYAPRAHPALCVSEQKMPEKKWNEWADEVLSLVNHGKDSFVILADGVNPLTATLNDFSFLDKINKPVTVVIDDSHGIGLLGEHGEGSSFRIPKNKNVDLIISFSMAKAFGLEGGVICSSSKNIEAIKELPHYTAGTGMIPAFMHTFMQAKDLYQRKRTTLRSLTKYFIEKNQKQIFKFNEALPVFVTDQHQLDEHCKQHGIIISSFSYPVASGTITTRIILNSEHSFADLDVLISSLRSL